MVNISRIKRSVFQDYGIISVLGDFILLNGLFLLALMIRYDQFGADQEKDIRTLIAFLNIVWFSMMFLGRTYIFSRNEAIERILGRNIRYVFFLIVIAYSLTEILHFDTISRLVHAYFFSFFLISIALFRLLLIKYIKSKRRSGKSARFVVVVGGKQTSNSIANHLTGDGSSGYKIIGVFNDLNENLEWDGGSASWTGNRKDLIQFLKENWVDELYFPISELSNEEFHDIVKLCESKLIRIKMIPNLNKFTMKHKVGIEFHGNIPVFAFIRTPLESHLNRFLKRSFDILFSTVIILTVFTWLFPIVMLIIKMTSRGPIFFTQKRSGINNKPFLIFKFRSMTVNPDSDKAQATRFDPRLTKFGRFMRKTSIDELPQFFNVLMGDMSVVGPRPHMLRHTREYSNLISEYLERHYILPGITGWAQVHGYRGETDTLHKMQKRVEYDIWYTENWSFLLDIRILFLTTKNALKGEANAF
jgi:undecaprenyl-phosphate galactose phosphotransferase/putative colanic acid biosynthesis UDP-glucose lipid carrier transferase